MELSKIIIKNPEKKDFGTWRAFTEVVNSQDNLEISIPEKAIEFVLSNEELRKGIFVALLEDKVIGFAGCMKNSSTSQNANFELIIHPNFRRQGLGSMMYRMILEHAKNVGIKNAAAFAKERMQQSVDFIQKRGFKPDKYSWKMDLKLSDVNYKTIPKGDCNIRAITTEDNKDYIDIMNAGFKKEGEELYTEKSFEMTLKNPDEYVFFIEQNGKIIATAAINLQKDISRGYIHNVTVYSEFRGKGFGEMTLNHCINIIKNANLNKASLNVYGDNKNALNLYKKLGFAEVDTDIIFNGEI